MDQANLIEKRITFAEEQMRSKKKEIISTENEVLGFLELVAKK